MLIIIALCPDGYDDGEKKSAYNFLVEQQHSGAAAIQLLSPISPLLSCILFFYCCRRHRHLSSSSSSRFLYLFLHLGRLSPRIAQSGNQLQLQLFLFEPFRLYLKYFISTTFINFINFINDIAIAIAAVSIYSPEKHHLVPSARPSIKPAAIVRSHQPETSRLSRRCSPPRPAVASPNSSPSLPLARPAVVVAAVAAVAAIPWPSLPVTMTTSVKFEKDTVRTAGTAATKASEDLVHAVGERLTGGKSQNGYLAAYLKELQSNPLRTKMITSGALFGIQELLASWIAHDRSKHGHYLNSRIPKMSLYGAFISAPLGHLLVGILQKIFAGRTSLKAKVLQILVSNLVVSPIQNVIYLTSMAIIAGARTFHQVRATVKAGFMPVMKVSWIVSPLSLAFAQQFLPEHTWVPFFNVIGFIIGTYINAHTKKKRLEALKRKVCVSLPSLHTTSY
ncbi:integral membrane protein, Mpv17/PMP22 family, putative [Trichophyton benhamiae CBS 112371]|uniref:Integral membrane protein, Mpv17/PMP22 family, putative n=1 Tax=Arthroderma benhamiae (strain ATCC MYA-4681 / CBS 112371) TaxID=663331 RepID=D4B4B5_ARTBC|nr:integral membrane protein, Mpv17/PMP22 family, putative [Trichophyton benhamiae CBS 112371]EFE29963.1 integral membrane protein, Mpv17/PMP22 family, putative [Trichophyton benhamiae CBS 112371]